MWPTTHKMSHSIEGSTVRMLSSSTKKPFRVPSNYQISIKCICLTFKILQIWPQIEVPSLPSIDILDKRWCNKTRALGSERLWVPTQLQNALCEVYYILPPLWSVILSLIKIEITAQNKIRWWQVWLYFYTISSPGCEIIAFPNFLQKFPPIEILLSLIFLSL